MRSALLLIVCMTGVSSALVIRHDTPTLSYENYAKESQFNAAVEGCVQQEIVSLFGIPDYERWLKDSSSRN